MPTIPGYDPDDPECWGDVDPEAEADSEPRGQRKRMTDAEAEEDQRLDQAISKIERGGEDTWVPKTPGGNATPASRK